MTIPTLTPRAAREQSTFRTLLSSMSHPGAIYSLGIEGSAPLIAIAEALVDHEVTFAVVPDQAELTDTILRQTGSHVASLDVAQYVFCDAESLQTVLTEAADGTWEYPDAGATIVCRVPVIAPEGEAALVLAGPGIRNTATVYVGGFTAEARRTFNERNASRPLGLDIIFAAGEGAIVSLTRYTRLQED